MLLEKIIDPRPDAFGNAREELALAAHHAMYCATVCMQCVDGCMAGPWAGMAQCIRTCLDCADVCTALHGVASRRTGINPAVLRAQLQACVVACEACAEECARHDQDHCRRAAVMCLECAEDCRAALATL